MRPSQENRHINKKGGMTAYIWDKATILFGIGYTIILYSVVDLHVFYISNNIMQLCPLLNRKKRIMVSYV